MSKEIIIDGDKAVLGRLASFVAKEAMLGKKVDIVNADKVMIIGHKQSILARFLWKKDLGGSNLNGPFVHANPEKILKRTVRGMLDYSKMRGRLAIKRVKCYNGIPKEFEGKKMIKGKGKDAPGISLLEVANRMR